MLPDMAARRIGLELRRSVGAYGQLHCISLILWQCVTSGLPRKNFLVPDTAGFPIFSYLHRQEKGDLVIRDDERNTVPNHTTRMANFDAARYLCQWSRLAKVIGGSLRIPPPNRSKIAGRFVIFDKSHKKEHGLFLYRDENLESNTSFQLLGQVNRYPVTISPSPLFRNF